jgi:hydrogenase maturation protease
MKSSTLIAAFGNPMAGDDGFGPAVASRLRKQSLTDADLLDVGAKPARMICHLAGYANLIIVDAAVSEDQYATELLEFDYFDPGRPKLRSETVVSTHAFGLADELELAGALGTLPANVIVLAAPAVCTDLGSNMRPELSTVVDRAAARIIELTHQFYGRLHEHEPHEAELSH